MSRLKIFQNEVLDHEISQLSIGGYCKQYNFDKNDPIRVQYNENILKEYLFNNQGETNTLALIKNIKPHAFYECMMMILDERIYSGIDELSIETCKKIFDIAYLFVEFVSNPEKINEFQLQNGNFQMVYNYDPFTLDKESGMSEKRFHMHLNYWPESEFQLEQIKITELSEFERINCIDPILIISGHILYDCFRNEQIIGELIRPESDEKTSLPYGLKLRYKNWNVLKKEDFVKKLFEYINY